jgi:hypothetical protein
MKNEDQSIATFLSANRPVVILHNYHNHYRNAVRNFPTNEDNRIQYDTSDM